MWGWREGIRSRLKGREIHTRERVNVQILLSCNAPLRNGVVFQLEGDRGELRRAVLQKPGGGGDSANPGQVQAQAQANALCNSINWRVLSLLTNN
jgi:hypothetical protein